MNKNKTLIAAGQLSLALGILSFILNILFLDNNYFFHFATGLLLGLSLVLNLTYLIKIK